MLFAIGPALGALSAVGSLLDSAATNLGSAANNELSSLSQQFSAATGQALPTPAGTTPSTPFNAGTMAALISLQGQTGAASGPSALFSKLDANGDGSTVNMTAPAAQSGNTGTQNGGASTQSNLIEKLIQMQSALISTQASATAAVA